MCDVRKCLQLTSCLITATGESYTSRMLPTSEKRYWRSSSRWRTRRLSLRSWARSRSTSSRGDDVADGDASWWWRGDDDVDSAVPGSDDGRIPPDPGVSAPVDASTTVKLGPPPTRDSESSLCRRSGTPLTDSFCWTATQTRVQWSRLRNRFGVCEDIDFLTKWPLTYHLGIPVHLSLHIVAGCVAQL